MGFMRSSLLGLMRLFEKLSVPNETWTIARQLRRFPGRAYSRIGSARPANSDSNGCILVEGYTELEYLVPAIASAQMLRETLNAKHILGIHQGLRIPLVARLFLKAPRHSRLKRAFPGTLKHHKEAKEIADDLVSGSMTTSDFLGIEYSGVRVGLHAYETYLRAGNSGQFAQPKGLLSELEFSVRSTIWWRELLARECVKAVIFSHDCYSGFGPLVDLAENIGIPAYWVHPLGISRRQNRSTSWGNMLGRYRERFDELDSPTQGKILAEARQSIYSISQMEIGKRQIADPFDDRTGLIPNYLVKPWNSEIGVVALHDFTDNPHVYGKMWFTDFWEWANFVARATEASEATWFLKPHPGLNDGGASQLAVESLLSEFTHLRLLDPEVSWQEIATWGNVRVVSYYGTVGHELPLLGIEVVEASPNPHEEFGFVLTADTPSNYADLIQSRIKTRNPVPVRELEVFWAMHYYYRSLDQLFFDHYRDLAKSQSKNESNAIVRRRQILASVLRGNRFSDSSRTAKLLFRFFLSSESQLHVGFLDEECAQSGGNVCPRYAD